MTFVHGLVRANRKIESSRNILLAKELIEAGMRLTNVRNLTGIGERDSYDLYREVFNESPSTGTVPNNPHYCTKNNLTQYHASAAYVIFMQVRAAAPKDTLLGRLLLDTYRLYTELIVKSHHDMGLFDIDRLYVVICSVENNILVVRKCSCDATYVAAHHSGSKCPVCSSVRRQRCSCCGVEMIYSTMIPRDTPGRYSSLCAQCKSVGNRPKRRPKPASSPIYADGGSLHDWGFSSFS